MTWVWIGYVVQAVGTAIAGFALWEDWHKHANGRWIVPIDQAARWIGNKLGIRQTMPTGSATGTVTLTGTAEGRSEPPRDAPLDVQVQWLRDHMSDIDRRFYLQRAELAEVQRASRERDEDLQASLDGTKQQLKKDFDEFATGRVRAELLGLILVLVGSAISTANS